MVMAHDTVYGLNVSCFYLELFKDLISDSRKNLENVSDKFVDFKLTFSRKACQGSFMASLIFGLGYRRILLLELSS